jgi:hypothetical protein
VANRKQQKRRAKEKRHEYELVLVDESGEERPIDTAELRTEKRDKDAQRAKGRPASKQSAGGKKVDAKGRPIREVKPPAWNRVWKRAIFFGAFMFLVLAFVGGRGKDQSMANVLLPTVLYTLLFLPMLYLLDRVQYNQYLRRTGQSPASTAATKPKGSATPSDGESTGPLGGLRRAFRR